MTGLPIASHQIGCQFVESGSQAMNLSWICSDFLVEHCAQCPHHSPNGDSGWGAGVITQRRESAEKRERQARQRQEHIESLRTNLREELKSIGDRANPESRRIIEFLDEMFVSDVEKQSSAATYIKQSAQLAPELFSAPAIDLILTVADAEEFGAVMLPICSELAGRRTDLSARLEMLALNSIRRGMLVEQAATVLDRLGSGAAYPLDSESIKQLLLSQNHIIPIGGWSGGDPTYESSTNVLVRSYDSAPASVSAVIQQYLGDANDTVRIQLCGAIRLIQKLRPELAIALLPDLLRSLELYEDERLGTGTPSGGLVRILRAAFRHAPKTVDEFFGTAIANTRPTVQEDLVNVYRDQFIDRSIDWRDRTSRKETDDVSLAERMAIARLLLWIRDDKIEVDIRNTALDALELACRYATGAFDSEFDSLLGYFALVCQQIDPPPQPPKIIVPGQSTDPQLESLKAYSRKQNWGFFKYKLQKCLETLCEQRPLDTFGPIHDCFNKSSDIVGIEFRGTLLELLGKLGREYELRPQILPQLMRGLMDYGSPWVRAQAIKALVEMFAYSKAAPPADMIDVIVVHLQDSYVVVHKAAVKAVSRRPRWFNAQQRREALSALAVHLDVYRKDAYELEHICDAIVRLGIVDERLKITSQRMALSVLPTGDKIIDSRIIRELMRSCGPADRLSPSFAKVIGEYLAATDRDRFNGSSDRQTMFDWLHRMEPGAFERAAAAMLVSAKRLAERDNWESCHFASLFSHFGRFQNEQEILAAARNGVADEPRHADFRRELERLASIAAANAALQTGDIDSARACFDLAFTGNREA